MQRRPNIEWKGKMAELVEETEYLGRIINDNWKVYTDIKNSV
jgi:hypothetical protein